MIVKLPTVEVAGHILDIKPNSLHLHKPEVMAIGRIETAIDDGEVFLNNAEDENDFTIRIAGINDLTGKHSDNIFHIFRHEKTISGYKFYYDTKNMQNGQ